MTQDNDAFRIKDGIVSTEAVHFDEAVKAVARQRLRGVLVTNDFGVKQSAPHSVDLSQLVTVPFVEEFGFSPGFDPKRIRNFEALYELPNLKTLGMHSYVTVDLSHFSKLETLFLTDGPKCRGLDSLTELRYARVWKLKVPDLSYLANLPRLTELWLIQMQHEQIQGLDKSRALSILELSHNPKLARVRGIPKSLTTLRIKKCPKLRDLQFLDHHPDLDFLYVDLMESLAFVPNLPRLAYVGFENVLDGDLSPLLKSPSVSKVGFHPAKRKHYSHTLAEINESLAMKS